MNQRGRKASAERGRSKDVPLLSLIGRPGGTRRVKDRLEISCMKLASVFDLHGVSEDERATFAWAQEERRVGKVSSSAMITSEPNTVNK